MVLPILRVLLSRDNLHTVHVAHMMTELEGRGVLNTMVGGEGGIEYHGWGGRGVLNTMVGGGGGY